MAGKILRPGDERDILAAKFEIERTNTFHVKNMYEWFHDHLAEDEWEDTDEVGGDNFEHYYWRLQTPDGKSNHRMWWRLQRNPSKSKYFRWVLAITFRYLKASEVQMVHNGQKVETWNGNLTMLVETWLQLDYQNKWRKHWFLKHIDRLYRNRIWKRQKDKWKDELWRESYKISGWLKQYLQMKVPFKQPEIFHPPGGTGPNPPGD